MDLVKNCLEFKGRFAVFDEKESLGMDDLIFSVLVKSQAYQLEYDKIILALMWDRIDLAEKPLRAMTQWIDSSAVMDDLMKEKTKGFEKLLIMSLATNNVPFVKLLSNCGFSLRSLLSKEGMESLMFWMESLKNVLDFNILIFFNFL